MIRKFIVATTILAAVLLAGCSQSGPAPTESSGPDPAGRKYLLEQEPAGARSVTDIRKYANDGDEVVVIGRIGEQGNKPWIEGRASFVIADVSFEACTKCEDPYCEIDEAEFKRGRASVKVIDEQGKPVDRDARTLLGLKDLDVVVVKGKVRKKGDEFAILATALHHKPEPK